MKSDLMLTLNLPSLPEFYFPFSTKNTNITKTYTQLCKEYLTKTEVENNIKTHWLFHAVGCSRNETGKLRFGNR